jgi:hypothetical protein
MNGKTSLGELLFILAMFLPMLLMGILGMWPLFWVFLAFNIFFGLTEWFYTVKTGMTVSQHFWAYSKKHKWKAIAILVAMLGMWVALIAHLGVNLF